MNSSLENRCLAYFNEFLPSLRGKLLLEDLKALSSCFEIRVTELDCPPWRLVIENGSLSQVGHDGPDPVCAFIVSLQTALDVFCARKSPQEAFFEQKIEIDGDIETGLKLSTALEPFFKRYPFDG